MKIIDIKNLIFDEVSIYSNQKYETLWTGNICEMPTNYLYAEIGVIGAQSGGIVDIGIKDIPE